MKNNKYGFINAKGKIIVPIEYDVIGKFGEIGKDWAVVMKNNKYGLMNLDGKEIIPCQYENIIIKGGNAIVTKNGRTKSIQI